jgi:hypothetical protein
VVLLLPVDRMQQRRRDRRAAIRVLPGDRRDAFHVFIYAPFANKMRRLQSLGRCESDANELAETVDRDRAAFIKRYFNLEWPAIHRFHLMINSSIGDGVAAETILEAAARYGEKRQ